MRRDGRGRVAEVCTGADAVCAEGAEGEARRLRYSYEDLGLGETVVRVRETVPGMTGLEQERELRLDVSGQVTSVSWPRPLGEPAVAAELARFGYDAEGKVTTVTTPRMLEEAEPAPSFSLAYTRVGQREALTGPLSGSVRYRYDTARRPLALALASNGSSEVRDWTLVWHYEGALPKRAAAWYQEEGEPAQDVVFYDYAVVGDEEEDTAVCGGRLRGLTRGGEELRYRYGGPFVKRERARWPGGETDLVIERDDLWRVSALEYAGLRTEYGYDGDGLLTRAGPLGSGWAIERDGASGWPRRIAQEGASGQARELTYNRFGEPDGVRYLVGGVEVYAWGVAPGGRDGAGRLTDRWERLGGSEQHSVYGYDALGRLTGVTVDGEPREWYAYDANGNRVSYGNVALGQGWQDLGHDLEDRPVWAGAVEYTADGFLRWKALGAGEALRAWHSWRGELVRAEVTRDSGTVLVSYGYDALGRRVSRAVSRDGGVTFEEERYQWLGMTRLLAVRGPSGELRRRYEYAEGRAPVAMEVLEGPGVGRYTLCVDQVGSLRLVVDQAGQVVKEVTYDAFGNVLSDSAPSFEVSLGFAGGLHDRETGLVLFGYRDYDPQMGRWSAKDPIDFYGGDVNLYGYVLNDPVNLTDSTGLIWDTIWDVGNII
ncbi:MAG TPA: RHS repeat-associated core domain-containing protein, partial [Methylomirabilota bacterium]|nr:RHS repeat-associated core domain-containing protein [Methylomirabilota bacterium]